MLQIHAQHTSIYPHRVPAAAAATLALCALITSLGCPAVFPESSLFFKHLCWVCL